MLRRAQQRLQNQALPDRLVEPDALHLPCAGSSFDGVVLTFAFSAIPDGLTALCEMYRILRPSGQIVLVDACCPDNGNRFARGLSQLWKLFG